MALTYTQEQVLNFLKTQGGIRGLEIADAEASRVQRGVEGRGQMIAMYDAASGQILPHVLDPVRYEAKLKPKEVIGDPQAQAVQFKLLGSQKKHSQH